MKREQSHRTRAHLLRSVVNVFDQLLVVLEGVLVDLAQERDLGVGHHGSGDGAHLVARHVNVGMLTDRSLAVQTCVRGEPAANDWLHRIALTTPPPGCTHHSTPWVHSPLYELSDRGEQLGRQARHARVHRRVVDLDGDGDGDINGDGASEMWRPV